MGGTPIAGWFILEHPIKNGWWQGVPHVRKLHQFTAWNPSKGSEHQCDIRWVSGSGLRTVESMKVFFWCTWWMGMSMMSYMVIPYTIVMLNVEEYYIDIYTHTHLPMYISNTPIIDSIDINQWHYMVIFWLLSGNLTLSTGNTSPCLVWSIDVNRIQNR